MLRVFYPSQLLSPTHNKVETCNSPSDHPCKICFRPRWHLTYFFSLLFRTIFTMQFPIPSNTRIQLDSSMTHWHPFALADSPFGYLSDVLLLTFFCVQLPCRSARQESNHTIRNPSSCSSLPLVSFVCRWPPYTDYTTLFTYSSYSWPTLHFCPRHPLRITTTLAPSRPLRIYYNSNLYMHSLVVLWSQTILT